MNENKKQSGWGKGLFILYGSFAIFILFLVFYVSFNEINLVEPDYYRAQLGYQDKIEKKENCASLTTQPSLVYKSDNKIIELTFPSEIQNQMLDGIIRFMRPSDYRLDFKVNLSIDSTGSQLIDLASLLDGFWRIEIEWQSDNDKFLFESTVNKR